MAHRPTFRTRAVRRRAPTAPEDLAPATRAHGGGGSLPRPDAGSDGVTRVVAADLVATRDGSRGLRRDLKVLLDLRHTNLVSATAFDPRTHTVTYEKVGGISLRRLLRDGDALPLDAAMVVYDDCLAALVSLHSAGLEHGALSADTLVIETSGAVLVRDACIGQAAGPARTVAADLHAAAVVFNRAATGRQAQPLIKRHRGRRTANGHAAPPSPVPVGARMLLRRALDADVTARRATATDARHDVAEAAVSFLGPAWRRSGRAWLAEAVTAVTRGDRRAGESVWAIAAAATDVDAAYDTAAMLDGAGLAMGPARMGRPLSPAPVAVTAGSVRGGGPGLIERFTTRLGSSGRRRLGLVGFAAALVLIAGLVSVFQSQRSGLPRGGALALTIPGGLPGALTASGPGAIGAKVSPATPTTAPTGTPAPQVQVGIALAPTPTPFPTPGRPTANATPTPAPAVGAPGAPGIGGASAGAPGSRTATVSFSAPSSNGSAITSYTVRATDQSGGASGQSASGPSSPLTVSGLTIGDTYVFTVNATNGSGPGPSSQPSNPVTPAAAPPGAPVMGSATAGAAGTGTATVTFTAPASDGGTPIQTYTVLAVNQSPGGTNGQQQSSSGSPITVRGLTMGDTYTFSVTATNAAGSGPASPQSNAVTPLAAAPDAPANISALADGNGSGAVTVTFTAPNNRGSAITQYTLTAFDVTTNSAGPSVTEVGSPMHMAGLTVGDKYTFTVTATNGVGTSPSSAPSNEVTVS